VLALYCSWSRWRGYIAMLLLLVCPGPTPLSSKPLTFLPRRQLNWLPGSRRMVCLHTSNSSSAKRRRSAVMSSHTRNGMLSLSHCHDSPSPITRQERRQLHRSHSGKRILRLFKHVRHRQGLDGTLILSYCCPTSLCILQIYM
jgi:hypothetical protein